MYCVFVPCTELYPRCVSGFRPAINQAPAVRGRNEPVVTAQSKQKAAAVCPEARSDSSKGGKSGESL